MTAHAAVDVAILGGGIAGLWLLNRLKRLGYQAVLLERDAIGSGQTRYSQGIIHGGTKYALTGQLTGSADAVAAMPALWRACLQGDGEIDLSSVALLSEHQCLWSTTSLTSRMAGFFASKMMRSRTAALVAHDYPAVLQHPDFKGQVYQLDEPVLDIGSLLTALTTPNQQRLFQLQQPLLERDEDQNGWWISSGANGGEGRLFAKRVVLTAGEGNAPQLQQGHHQGPTMQLRPLLMVMVRGGAITTPLYAHCLGGSTTPRITVTSHRDQRGDWVWYLGGALAEEGVGRSSAEQIAAAKGELHQLFPWLQQHDLQWATLPINRAEVATAGGKRPEQEYFATHQGVTTAWPTKLVLAPLLAQRIIDELQADGIVPSDKGILPQWPHATIAPLPWQQEERWS